MTKAPRPEVPGADLGWCLGVILRRWHQEVERAVEGVPHGVRGYQILSFVEHNPSPTQSSLAKHLGIDKTVMPYIIDALEAEDLVERQTDAADRRVRRICITPPGTRLLRELETRIRHAEDVVFEGVAPEVRAAFVENATRLAATIHAADPSMDACTVMHEALERSAGTS